MSVQSPRYLRALAKVESKADATVTSEVLAASAQRTRTDKSITVLNAVDEGAAYRLVYSVQLAMQLAREIIDNLPPTERSVVIASLVKSPGGAQ